MSKLLEQRSVYNLENSGSKPAYQAVSLRMHPGTVPVVLLLGSTLQLASAWGVGWKTLAAA